MSTIALPRRGTRRLPRVDGRLATGVVLVAMSVLGGLRLVAAADSTVGVAVAARDLPAGHVLRSGDLRVARLHASSSVLARLVRAERVRSMTGRVTLAPVRTDGLITSANITRSPRQGREITVPVTPEHALGGDLHAGERVDVLASFAKSGKDARTLAVVRSAEVVAAVRAEGLFGQRAGALTAVTLSVTPDDAVFVAFAIRNGDLDIVRATGGAPSTHDRFDASQLP